MPHMTPQQALHDCIKVWEYLARTGSRDKCEAIVAARLRYEPIFSCPACEYDYRMGQDNCLSCPVDAWRRIAPTVLPRTACNVSGSPYYGWREARSTDERRAEARKIIRLCLESLDRLEEPGPTPPEPNAIPTSIPEIASEKAGCVSTHPHSNSSHDRRTTMTSLLTALELLEDACARLARRNATTPAMSAALSRAHAVPEPLTTALEVGTTYYVPVVFHENLYKELTWDNDKLDRLWLERGLIHATRDAAIAHAEAMIRSKQP